MDYGICFTKRKIVYLNLFEWLDAQEKYIKEWSKREYNTGTLKRRYFSEHIFDDIKDDIKLICILEK